MRRRQRRRVVIPGAERHARRPGRRRVRRARPRGLHRPHQQVLLWTTRRVTPGHFRPMGHARLLRRSSVRALLALHQRGRATRRARCRLPRRARRQGHSSAALPRPLGHLRPAQALRRVLRLILQLRPAMLRRSCSPQRRRRQRGRSPARPRRRRAGAQVEHRHAPSAQPNTVRILTRAEAAHPPGLREPRRRAVPALRAVARPWRNRVQPQELGMHRAHPRKVAILVEQRMVGRHDHILHW